MRIHILRIMNAANANKHKFLGIQKTCRYATERSLTIHTEFHFKLVKES